MILLITLCLLPRLVEAKILFFGNATDPGLGLPTGHPNGYPFVWPDTLYVSEGIFNEATCLDSDHEYQIQTGVNQFNGVLGEGWQPLDKFYAWTRKHRYYYLWYGGFMAGPGNGPGTRSKEAFINWVTAAAGRAPGIEYINFANEPIHAGSAHPFARQWGGAGSTGYDWLINIGKLFRAKFPNAQLGINDFQQESSVDDLPYGPGQNKTQLPQFLRMVKVLKDAGVIDWVGLEGYSLETVPSEHLSSALNQISQLGVKVIFTEFSPNAYTANKSTQLANWQRLMSVILQNPAVIGVSGPWSFRKSANGGVSGSQWIVDDSANPASNQGVDNPTMTWLKTFIPSVVGKPDPTQTSNP